MNEILAALESAAPPSLLLLLEGVEGEALRSLSDRARALGIPMRIESAREMRRMAPEGSASESGPPLALALIGPRPALELKGVFANPGLVLGLVGLRYPGNVGFILRSVEVAGGAGVLVDSDWGDAQMDEALRTGMRPERFMPVLRADVTEMISEARRVGRAIVAMETCGEQTPWDVDFSKPSLLLVGGETEGLPLRVLDEADAVVRIPTSGFIPSYNVQAAVGICLGEWLRQNV